MLAFVSIGGPYCGETIVVVVDDSVEQQQTIEACQVCCRPIVLVSGLDEEGELFVQARTENDA